MKRKKIKNEIEGYSENKDRNIEKNVCVILILFLKQSKKGRKSMATNC